MKKLPFLIGLSFSLIFLTISALASGQENRRPYRFLIPDEYVGWVRVDFNVKDAPALPIEDGYYIIKIPPTGRLQTATDDDFELKGDEYYYVCGNTKRILSTDVGSDRTRIWDRFSGPAGVATGTSLKFRYAFVGTRVEFDRFAPNFQPYPEKEDDGFPKVGPKYAVECKNK